MRLIVLFLHKSIKNVEVRLLLSPVVYLFVLDTENMKARNKQKIICLLFAESFCIDYACDEHVYDYTLHVSSHARICNAKFELTIK